VDGISGRSLGGAYRGPQLVTNLTRDQSLSSGRASRLSAPNMDCQYPEGIDKRSPGATIAQAADALTRDAEIGFPDGHDILAEIVASAAAVVPPTYSTVINLDIKLRELRTADVHVEDPGNLVGYPTVSLGLCPLLWHILPLTRQISALMYLHRAFFVRALRDNPSNPASSAYGPSFHATVRSVREVIDWLFSAYNANPDVAICLAYEWTIGVTAAVRNPGEVFESVEPQTPRRWSTPV
jgi:hypothetical protein